MHDLSGCVRHRALAAHVLLLVIRSQTLSTLERHPPLLFWFHAQVAPVTRPQRPSDEAAMQGSVGAAVVGGHCAAFIAGAAMFHIRVLESHILVMPFMHGA